MRLSGSTRSPWRTSPGRALAWGSPFERPTSHTVGAWRGRPSRWRPRTAGPRRRRRPLGATPGDGPSGGDADGAVAGISGRIAGTIGSFCRRGVAAATVWLAKSPEGGPGRGEVRHPVKKWVLRHLILQLLTSLVDTAMYDWSHWLPQPSPKQYPHSAPQNSVVAHAERWARLKSSNSAVLGTMLESYAAAGYPSSGHAPAAMSNFPRWRESRPWSANVAGPPLRAPHRPDRADGAAEGGDSETWIAWRKPGWPTCSSSGAPGRACAGPQRARGRVRHGRRLRHAQPGERASTAKPRRRRGLPRRPETCVRSVHRFRIGAQRPRQPETAGPSAAGRAVVRLSRRPPAAARRPPCRGGTPSCRRRSAGGPRWHGAGRSAWSRARRGRARAGCHAREPRRR